MLILSMNKFGLRFSFAVKSILRREKYDFRVLSLNFSELSSRKKPLEVVELPHRQVISLEGKDASNFLQGIVTNDVSLLPEMKCMYSMILNQHGRVMHDIILYHQGPVDSDSYKIYVECEELSTDSLLKMFKLYKLRKKLSITTTNIQVLQALNSHPNCYSEHDGILACGIDPRTPSELGYRILCESLPKDTIMKDLTDYHRARVSSGIPEGSLDLPPGNCLPLESNLDYMNGVSFHKGCYIGQELTARTKFTGVIRKRLLPVTIKGDGDLGPGESIVNAKGKGAGKIRSIYRPLNLGLALVRLNYMNDVLYGKNGKFEFRCHVPSWWPYEDGSEFSDGVCGPNSDVD